MSDAIAYRQNLVRSSSCRQLEGRENIKCTSLLNYASSVSYLKPKKGIKTHKIRLFRSVQRSGYLDYVRVRHYLLKNREYPGT